VPDMPVFEDPTEWDADIVFPGLDRLSPIHLYVERLAAYWVRSKPDLRALTREELDKFEDFLRANFEVAPTLGSAVDPGKADMVWLTKQQRNALDLMSEHDHALIGGPAGTGKTFLALEQARRLAARGKRTLLLCHNSLLGDYLGRVVAQPSYKGLVDANAVLNYLFGTIKSSSLYSEFAGEARKSSSAGVYSQYFLKAANEVGVVKYDAMVMDQGNDVLNGDTLFALDYVLQGGFECGAWYVFYDDSTKTDVGEGFVSEVVSHLTSFVPGELHLTLNCRATESIAIHTAAATGFQMACAHTAGEKVKYRWYDDPEGQLEDLKKVVGVLLNDGLAPEEITILYPASQSYLRDGLKETRLRAPVAELGVDCKFPGDRGKIGFASIQAFRGLENRAIVLLGVDRIGEPWADALNYLGMSRARSVLVVFMHRRIRKEYEAQLARVAESGVPLVSD